MELEDLRAIAGRKLIEDMSVPFNPFGTFVLEAIAIGLPNSVKECLAKADCDFVLLQDGDEQFSLAMRIDYASAEARIEQEKHLPELRMLLHSLLRYGVTEVLIQDGCDRAFHVWLDGGTCYQEIVETTIER